MIRGLTTITTFGREIEGAPPIFGLKTWSDRPNASLEMETNTLIYCHFRRTILSCKPPTKTAENSLIQRLRVSSRPHTLSSGGVSFCKTFHLMTYAAKTYLLGKLVQIHLQLAKVNVNRGLEENSREIFTSHYHI